MNRLGLLPTNDEMRSSTVQIKTLFHVDLQAYFCEEKIENALDMMMDTTESGAYCHGGVKCFGAITKRFSYKNTNQNS